MILLDVEFPVAIKVSGEVDGSEFDDRLSHRLGPAHPGALHAVFDEVLARAFDRTTGNGPPVSEVFVIWHARSIPVKVAGDCLHCFAFGAGQAALGDRLPDPFDHLTHFTE